MPRSAGRLALSSEAHSTLSVHRRHSWASRPPISASTYATHLSTQAAQWTSWGTLMAATSSVTTSAEIFRHANGLNNAGDWNSTVVILLTRRRHATSRRLIFNPTHSLITVNGQTQADNTFDTPRKWVVRKPSKEPLKRIHGHESHVSSQTARKTPAAISRWTHTQLFQFTCGCHHLCRLAGGGHRLLLCTRSNQEENHGSPSRTVNTLLRPHQPNTSETLRRRPKRAVFQQRPNHNHVIQM